MLYLLSIGLLSGLFFSSTFILNRSMSLDGGSWVWSASLRYMFMIILLSAVIACFQGLGSLLRVLKLFRRNWRFWTIAGSVGFGCFYALLCYSAEHAPGWVIASTWQLTIIASLIVLLCFGRSFPKRIWFFSLMVFAGVLMVNLSHMDGAGAGSLLAGAIPVLIASFCYPIGNQLVWEAKNGNASLPDINHPLLGNVFNKVFLMSIGTIPFWAILVGFTAPDLPSRGQLMNTALVALFSGILATCLFLLARNKAKKPSELAAVDATQSSEVVFALLGEVFLLSAPWPGGVAGAGMILVFVGLALFIYFQEAAHPPVPEQGEHLV